MPPPTITSYSRPTRKLWRTRNHPHQGSGWLCTEHLSVYTANQDLRGLEIRTSKYKCAAAELDTQPIVLLSGKRQKQLGCFRSIVSLWLLIRRSYQMLTQRKKLFQPPQDPPFFRCRGDSHGDCVGDILSHNSSRRWCLLTQMKFHSSYIRIY